MEYNKNREEKLQEKILKLDYVIKHTASLNHLLDDLQKWLIFY